jgi:hypothetical protein
MQQYSKNYYYQKVHKAVIQYKKEKIYYQIK